MSLNHLIACFLYYNLIHFVEILFNLPRKVSPEIKVSLLIPEISVNLEKKGNNQFSY